MTDPKRPESARGAKDVVPDAEYNPVNMAGKKADARDAKETGEVGGAGEVAKTGTYNPVDMAGKKAHGAKPGDDPGHHDVKKGATEKKSV